MSFAARQHTAGVSTLVELSGTSGSYNLASAIATSGQVANAIWVFTSGGGVIHSDGVSATGTEDWMPGVEWFPGAPDRTYYIRATLMSGTPLSGGTLDSWLSLASNRSWNLIKAGPGTGTLESYLKIEIALDAAGAIIVATGYYKLAATYA